MFRERGGVTFQNEQVDVGERAARPRRGRASSWLARRIRWAGVGWGCSWGLNSSSWNFSPGRAPTISIAMSRSGSSPDRRIIVSASSMILIGSPISSTKISPLRLAQRAGPDDQLDRLRDGHEVAGHALVGDGHRTAGGDLAAEDRHHRARGAEHVAEAHGGVPRGRVPDRRGLDRPLGERLGGAHHGRRHDGLVGGDEHERADAAPRRRSGPRAGWPARCCGSPRRGSAPSSPRACRRRRGRRPPAGARSSTSRIRSSSLQSASTGTAVRTWRSSSSSRRDLEQVVLGVVDEHQPARADAGDLAAQLGADRAAGAGDQHHLAGQVGADALRAPRAPARGRACPRRAPRAAGG